MSAPPSYPQAPLAQQQQQQQVPEPSPMSPAQQQLDSTLLSLFQSLTELQTVAGSVVAGNEALVSNAAERTIADLSKLSLMKPSIEGGVHPAVLELVEQDKNPHAFTRDTLERASGENQFANGKLHALASYTELLDAQLEDAFPELKGILRTTSEAVPPSVPAARANGAQPSSADAPGRPHDGDVKMD